MGDSLIDILNEKNEIVLFGSGLSMWPMLKPNKYLIKLKKIDRPVEKYDVVLFQRGDKFVLHSVMKVDGDKILTGGDNTYYNDGYIDASQVVAILTDFVRNVDSNKDRVLNWVSVDNVFYKLYARGVVHILPIRRYISRTFLSPIRRYFNNKKI